VIAQGTFRAGETSLLAPIDLMMRTATAADASAIAAIYSPYVEKSTSTMELEAPDAAEITRRISDVQDRGLPYLVAEVDGVVAGYAYASPFRPRAGYRFTVEDSVYLLPEFAGQGLGRRLLGALIEGCEQAGCKQMVAVIAGKNQASIAMHSALGFAEAGVLHNVGFKLGQWVDVTMMQREL
jgi:L-amino acid N-acyltransferase YncA